jgi:hypothetical protein
MHESFGRKRFRVKVTKQKAKLAAPPRISPCPLNVSWLCGIFVENTANLAGFTGYTVS